MGKLRDKMTEDLLLRRYAPSTSERYVDCARAFVAYHRRPPEEMGEREVRQYLLDLALERKVGAATQKMHVAALKFLYTETASGHVPASVGVPASGHVPVQRSCARPAVMCPSTPPGEELLCR